MKIFIKNDLDMFCELDGTIHRMALSESEYFTMDDDEDEYIAEVDDIEVEDDMTLALSITGLGGTWRISCEDEVNSIEDNEGINIYDYFYTDQD